MLALCKRRFESASEWSARYWQVQLAPIANSHAHLGMTDANLFIGPTINVRPSLPK